MAVFSTRAASSTRAAYQHLAQLRPCIAAKRLMRDDQRFGLFLQICQLLRHVLMPCTSTLNTLFLIADCALFDGVSSLHDTKLAAQSGGCCPALQRDEIFYGLFAVMWAVHRAATQLKCDGHASTFPASGPWRKKPWSAVWCVLSITSELRGSLPTPCPAR